MATQRLPAAGSHTWGSGAYYLTLAYTETNDAFEVQVKCTVTKAFEKAHQIIININGKQYKSGESAIKNKTTWESRKRTISGGVPVTVKVRLVGDDTFTFTTLTHNASINPPTISATAVSDVQALLSISGTASIYKPVSEIEIYKKTDGGMYSSMTFDPGTGTTYTAAYTIEGYDIDIEAGHTYTYKARAKNGDSTVSSWSNEVTIQTSASASTIQNQTATRVSNQEVTVEWEISSASDVASGNIAKFVIARATNGNTYTALAEVDANENLTSYSYSDTTTAKDNVYKYKISAKNSAGAESSSGQVTDAVYMTPTEPQSLALALNSGNYPVLTISNTSNSAESVEIQRTENSGSSWTTESTEEYPVSSYASSEAVESGDSVNYRIRNVGNSDLSSADRYSAWVTAGTEVSIETKSKPNAPTLTYPLSGQKFTLDEGSVTLKWKHNSTDGSAQESATVQYKVGSGSWQTAAVTTAQQYTLSFSSLSANDVITWKVSTKGAYATASDYSAESTFTVLSKPQIVWTSPTNNETIDSLPLTLSWTYSDLSGTLQSLTVYVKQNSKIIMTKSATVGSGTSGSYSLVLDDFLPDNNTRYNLVVSALSSSALRVQEEISVSIEFEEATLSGGLVPVVNFDSETGIAQIMLQRDITSGVTPLTITNTFLYRIHDGDTEFIASGLSEGSTVYDKMCPIRADYSYKLMQITQGGDIGVDEYTFYNDSPYWFCYFDGGTAKAKWNPEGQIKLSRPEKEEIRYSGRKYPVSYDSDAREETFSFSGTLADRDELQPFRELMKQGGSGIWKSGDGDVYPANFEVSYQKNFYKRNEGYELTVSVTRIEGDGE